MIMILISPIIPTSPSPTICFILSPIIPAKTIASATAVDFDPSDEIPHLTFGNAEGIAHDTPLSGILVMVGALVAIPFEARYHRDGVVNED